MAGESTKRSQRSRERGRAIRGIIISDILKRRKSVVSMYVPLCIEKLAAVGSSQFRATSKLHDYLMYLYNKPTLAINATHVRYDLLIEPEIKAMINEILVEEGALIPEGRMIKRSPCSGKFPNVVESYSVDLTQWEKRDIILPESVYEAHYVNKKLYGTTTLTHKLPKIETFYKMTAHTKGDKDSRPRFYNDSVLGMIMRPDGSFLSPVVKRTGNRLYSDLTRMPKTERALLTLNGKPLYEADCTMAAFTSVVRALAKKELHLPNIGDVTAVKNRLSEAEEEAKTVYNVIVAGEYGEGKERLSENLGVRARRGSNKVETLKKDLKYMMCKRQPGTIERKKDGTFGPVIDWPIETEEIIKVKYPALYAAIDTIRKWVWYHSKNKTMYQLMEGLEANWYIWMKQNCNTNLIRVHDAVYGTNIKEMERAMKEYFAPV